MFQTRRIHHGLQSSKRLMALCNLCSDFWKYLWSPNLGHLNFKNYRYLVVIALLDTKNDSELSGLNTSTRTLVDPGPTPQALQPTRRRSHVLPLFYLAFVGLVWTWTETTRGHFHTDQWQSELMMVPHFLWYSTGPRDDCLFKFFETLTLCTYSRWSQTARTAIVNVAKSHRPRPNSSPTCLLFIWKILFFVLVYLMSLSRLTFECRYLCTARRPPLFSITFVSYGSSATKEFLNPSHTHDKTPILYNSPLVGLWRDPVSSSHDKNSAKRFNSYRDRVLASEKCKKLRPSWERPSEGGSHTHTHRL